MLKKASVATKAPEVQKVWGVKKAWALALKLQHRIQRVSA
jgi:hypothetical protein